MAAIGRQFKMQSLDLGEREILLPDGKNVLFTAHHVKAADVEIFTVVDQAINGRDQETLTVESVSDITKSIATHQWFPVIAKYSNDGKKIEILDGSRRRLAAIQAGVGLDLLLAEKGCKLSSEDARAISKEIQTAREHTIRDLGVSLLPLWQAGKKQADIAKDNGLSVAKVNRALTAARVPVEVVTVFPDPNELTHPDYKALLKISDEVEKKNFSLTDLIQSVSDKKLEKFSDTHSHLKPDEAKAFVMSLFQAEFNTLFKKSKGKEFSAHPLLQFVEKDKYARKRVKGSKIHYEFNRLEADVRTDLDKAIKEVLDKHYEVQ